MFIRIERTGIPTCGRKGQLGQSDLEKEQQTPTSCIVTVSYLVSFDRSPTGSINCLAGKQGSKTKLGRLGLGPRTNPELRNSSRAGAFGAALPIELSSQLVVQNMDRQSRNSSWNLSFRSSARAAAMSVTSLVTMTSKGCPNRRVECTLPRRCSSKLHSCRSNTSLAFPVSA